MKKLTFAMCLFCLMTGTLSARVLPLVTPMRFSAVEIPHLPCLPCVGPVSGSLVDQQSTMAGSRPVKAKVTRIGFRKKMALKILSKRISLQRLLTETDPVAAEKKAQVSKNLGIWSLISMLAILLYPPLALVSVSLGIAAIVTGNQAKKLGSQYRGGITMGIIALIIVAVAGILALSASLFFLA